MLSYHRPVQLLLFFDLTLFHVIGSNFIELQESTSIKNNIQEMSLILKHFNEKVFLLQATRISLVVSIPSRTKEANYYFDDLITATLPFLMETKTKVTYAKDATLVEYCYFNLLLVDSFHSFRRLDIGSKTVGEDFSEFYLIILYANDDSWSMDVAAILDYCWKYYIVNVDVLVVHSTREPGAGNGTKHIPLYTFFPFEHQHCRRSVPRLLNLHRSVTDLLASELYPSKVDNLYKCSLRAALWHVPPYIFLSTTNLKTEGGFEGLLLETLMAVANFTLDVIVPKNNEQRGVVLPNGSLTGALDLLHRKIADLTLGCFSCSLKRSTVLTPSINLYQSKQILVVVNERQSWSSYEIIAYPFAASVWMALTGLIVILVFSAFLLKQLNRSLVKFLFGCSSYSNFLMKIVAVLLGVSVPVLPRRNCARYLLCLWLVLTLVLRSAYEGLLYNFLHNKKTTAPPNTIAELAQGGYQVIVDLAIGAALDNVDSFNSGHVKLLVMDISPTDGYAILEANKTKLYATSTPRNFLTYYINIHRKYGVFHELEEQIFSQQLCLYLTKHSYLTNRFDNIILNLRSGGLIDYWASKFFDMSWNADDVSKRQKNEENSLTMEHLKAIFQIQCGLWIIAVIVFSGEIIHSRLTRTKDIH